MRRRDDSPFLIPHHERRHTIHISIVARRIMDPREREEQ